MTTSTGLGIASLVLGILACLTCWIPFLGIIGIPLALIGVFLGVIGILFGFIQKTGKGLAFSGIIVSVVSIVITISIIGKTAKIITDSFKESGQTKQEIVPLKKDVETESKNELTTEKDINKTIPLIEWAPYDVAVKQGDVAVRVTNAQIGKIKVKDLFGTTKESTDLRLSLELEITNLSDVKKCEYKTWAGAEWAFERDYGSLQDEYGNTYKRVTFSLNTMYPEGRILQESIYPGKSIKDVLIFEVPVEKAKEIRLELPAKNIGGDGYFKIAIPTSFIKHQ